MIAISAKLIVRINSFIVCLKLCLLISIITVTLHVGEVKALSLPNFSSIKSPLPFFFIIINAFGFHYIIPSIVSYYGKDNALLFKKLLVLTTTLILILYLTWLYTIYHIIPRQGPHGLLEVYYSPNQIVAFNKSLRLYLHSSWMINLLTVFQGITLFGSFFCTSLAIFDFLIDVFKTKNRWLLGALTFTPTIFLVLTSENMYMHAMALASYIAILLEIVIPILAICSHAYQNFSLKVSSE